MSKLETFKILNNHGSKDMKEFLDSKKNLVLYKIKQALKIYGEV